jgi:D-amino-acid dehydrogenase
MLIYATRPGSSGKFVLTPMEGRLRAAGVIEFGGLEAGPSKGPIELLKRQIELLLPDITYDSIVEWMGHRPPLPIVCR